jgi:hypothetical protein
MGGFKGRKSLVGSWIGPGVSGQGLFHMLVWSACVVGISFLIQKYVAPETYNQRWAPVATFAWAALPWVIAAINFSAGRRISWFFTLVWTIALAWLLRRAGLRLDSWFGVILLSLIVVPWCAILMRLLPKIIRPRSGPFAQLFRQVVLIGPAVVILVFVTWMTIAPGFNPYLWERANAGFRFGMSPIQPNAKVLAPAGAPATTSPAGSAPPKKERRFSF